MRCKEAVRRRNIERAIRAQCDDVVKVQRRN